MNKIIYSGYLLAMVLAGCMPFSASNPNRYQLNTLGRVAPMSSHQHRSIVVMQPSASAGYDTDQMIYMNKPYQVAEFADNTWMSPPATMMLPLLIYSLESSHYFYAVAADPNVSKTDYRLESKLLRFQQNFLVKPSQYELVMQIILIHSADNRVVATHTINESLPCPRDNPMGGVIAANQATRKLTQRVTHFVIKQIEHDREHRVSDMA